MKKLLFLSLALLAPSVVFAAAASIDMSWNDCPSSGAGVQTKNFVCTGTANQTYTLALEFKTAISLPNFVGIRMDLDLQSSTPGPLAPFWHYEQGGCNRPASPGVAGVAMFDNVGSSPAGCQALPDPWGGDGTSGFEGIAAYAPDFYRPGNGHFVLGVAHSSSFPIDAKVNYYAAHMTFNNRNKNICAGCAQQVVIVWNSASAESNDGTPAQTLAFSQKTSNCVQINGGSLGSCDATPTKNTTWGQIKTLYRN